MEVRVVRKNKPKSAGNAVTVNKLRSRNVDEVDFNVVKDTIRRVTRASSKRTMDTTTLKGFPQSSDKIVLDVIEENELSAGEGNVLRSPCYTPTAHPLRKRKSLDKNTVKHNDKRRRKANKSKLSNLKNAILNELEVTIKVNHVDEDVNSSNEKPGENQLRLRKRKSLDRGPVIHSHLRRRSLSTKKVAVRQSNRKRNNVDKTGLHVKCFDENDVLTRSRRILESQLRNKVSVNFVDETTAAVTTETRNRKTRSRSAIKNTKHVLRAKESKSCNDQPFTSEEKRTNTESEITIAKKSKVKISKTNRKAGSKRNRKKVDVTVATETVQFEKAISDVKRPRKRTENRRGRTRNTTKGNLPDYSEESETTDKGHVERGRGRRRVTAKAEDTTKKAKRSKKTKGNVINGVKALGHQASKVVTKTYSEKQSARYNTSSEEDKNGMGTKAARTKVVERPKLKSISSNEIENAEGDMKSSKAEYRDSNGSVSDNEVILNILEHLKDFHKKNTSFIDVVTSDVENQSGSSEHVNTGKFEVLCYYDQHVDTNQDLK